jgi:hypothetical protein
MSSPVLHRAINAEQLESLRDVLIDHLTTTDATRERNVIRYIFREAIQALSNTSHPRRVSANDIKENVPGKGQPDNPEKKMISVFSAKMREFFDDHPIGRMQPYRVFFERGNYFPFTKVNEPPPKEEDFVALLWSPYHASGKQARIIYPEPLFFLDQHGTYLRNPAADEPKKQSNIFNYLAPCAGDSFEPRYSFVSAGIVQSILLLMRTFRLSSPERFVNVTPVRPDEEVSDRKENLIVLGTPSTTKIVEKLERPPFEAKLPLRTTATGAVLYEGAEDEEVFADDPEQQALNPNPEMLQWGVLTRRRSRFNDRIETLIAARQGRAVEAITKLLTDKEQIRKLARELPLVDRLRGGKEFQPSFQALFRVQMEKTDTGPRIHSTRVERAIPLPDPQWD